LDELDIKNTNIYTNNTINVEETINSEKMLIRYIKIKYIIILMIIRYKYFLNSIRFFISLLLINKIIKNI